MGRNDSTDGARPEQVVAASADPDLAADAVARFVAARRLEGRAVWLQLLECAALIRLWDAHRVRSGGAGGGGGCGGVDG